MSTCEMDELLGGKVSLFAKRFTKKFTRHFNTPSGHHCKKTAVVEESTPTTVLPYTIGSGAIHPQQWSNKPRWQCQSTQILQYTNPTVHKPYSTQILQYTNPTVHKPCSTQTLQYTNPTVQPSPGTGRLPHHRPPKKLCYPQSPQPRCQSSHPRWKTDQDRWRAD